MYVHALYQAETVLIHVYILFWKWG